MKNEGWSSFSATNAPRKDAKITCVRMNTQKPCPPCSAVPINQGRGGRFFHAARLDRLRSAEAYRQIVQALQLTGDRHLAAVEDRQKILRPRLDELACAKPVEGFGIHRPCAAALRGFLAVRLHLVHDGLPRPLCHGGVAGGQVGAGNLQVEDGLPERLIARIEQGDGFALVLGAQAGLLAGGGVFAVEDARAAEQDKTLFHKLIHES